MNEAAMEHNQYSTLNCEAFHFSFKLKNASHFGSCPPKYTLYFTSSLRHNTLSSAGIVFEKSTNYCPG